MMKKVLFYVMFAITGYVACTTENDFNMEIVDVPVEVQVTVEA